MSRQIGRKEPLRWGMFSAGGICHDMATCFSEILNPEEHKLVGVADRYKEDAIKFAADHGIPQAFDTYDELAQSDAIDVIYIGTVHPMHLTLAILALTHGKHVLCEKPLCVNVRETKELIHFAKERKLFLMEAYWTRFFPAYEQLRKELAQNSIGEIFQVTAGTGFNAEGNWRMWDKSICAGSVLDFGSYPIQLACLVFNAERPIKIVASGHLNEHGIDESSSATIIYKNGKTASLQTHNRVEFPNDAVIIGTKGVIKIGALFWAPTMLETPTKTFEYTLPTVKTALNNPNSEGLAYECIEVRRCLQAGLLESPFISHDESILIAEMRETIRKQIGVVYEQDTMM